MNHYLRLFFSFYGRVGRFVYWGGLVSCLATVGVVFLVTDVVVLRSAESPIAVALKDISLQIAFVVAAVSIVAFHMRRLHDRDLSGWWLIPAFAVMAPSGWWVWISGSLFLKVSVSPGGFTISSQVLALLVLAVTFYLIGGIAGTCGPNRFGPDPREEDLRAEPVREQARLKPAV